MQYVCVWPKLKLFAGVCTCGLSSDKYYKSHHCTQGKQHFWRADVHAYLAHFSDPSLTALSEHTIIFNVNLTAKQEYGDGCA